ncbi:UDP-N-acetylmuramate dehydrogenase [Planctobacterium marinum]|uniref:UDP-N-acetylmuramate dehydrogenase n=1 Tax=Planctobacterium marinum TaxID=1631968 RepID=UPI001E57D032|nr:UDP-N-acetylmuramate dehydrogenase [Planctobacterium marinum]MCC2608235.1 UDP-N-acetylmuramate dehydrogenase [Planctobacterium marinum]
MVNLKNRHTLSLQASCNNLYEVENIQDLDSLDLDHQHYFVLGGGSNVAFVEDFDGDIVTFTNKQLSITENDDSWLIETGAGVVWHDLVLQVTQKGIGGLENLALIPGNCGAAAVQNIGAYGVEFSALCKGVQTVNIKTKEIKELTNPECCFGYRNSIFKSTAGSDLLVTKICLQLPKKWTAKLTYQGLDSLTTGATPLSVMNKVIEIRQSKLPDPAKLANAGSFFKNPVVTAEVACVLKERYPEMPTYHQDKNGVKLSSGWLIEKAGFKGKKVDSIGTYEKHALVIVNYGQGSGQTLLRFVRDIKEQVRDLFSVTLENEVLLIGKNGVINL